MSISKFPFILFLAVSVVLYYLTPKARRYWILFAASVFFYVTFSIRAFLYLSFTVTATYVAANWLTQQHTKEKKALDTENCDRATIKSSYKRRRQRILALFLVLNFSTLVLLKYLDTWLGEVSDMLNLLDVTYTFRPLNLILPIGISFYIFQTSGYLIDTYRGRIKAEQNFVRHALFVAYFPQMIQGPINRFQNLHGQLIEGNDFLPDNLKYGIQLMLWGILKKTFIADPLAGAVSEVYNNFTNYGGLTILLAGVLYSLQLYCDFSGGTDLVRGASQLFGIEMAENFRRPYFSRSIDEFWRRWHMSLGEWMKDYLFYPMALSSQMNQLGKWAKRRFGDRGKLFVPSLSTFVVFLAVGIWQGPGLGNLAYGLWNGSLMSLAMILAPTFTSVKDYLKIRDDALWFRLFQIVRTFLLITIGRYFARAASVFDGIRMLWRIIRYPGLSTFGLNTFTNFGLSGGMWICLLFAVCVLLIVELLQEHGCKIRKTLESTSWLVQFSVLFVGLFLVIAFVYLNSDYIAISYVYENI